MSLKHSLLGLLSYNDSTGYDLAKFYEDSICFFWPAQMSQIYRDLNAMEELGWIGSRNVSQDKKPNKKVYYLNEAGKQELSKWLSNYPLDKEKDFNPWMIRVFFSGQQSIEENISILREYYERCQQKIDKLHMIASENAKHYAEEFQVQEDKQYWMMTIQFGIAQAEAGMKWAKSAIKLLEKGEI